LSSFCQANFWLAEQAIHREDGRYGLAFGEPSTNGWVFFSVVEKKKKGRAKPALSQPFLIR